MIINAMMKNNFRFLPAISALAGLFVSIYAAVIYLHNGSVPIENFAYIPYLNIPLSFNLSGISIVLLIMSSIVLLAASISGNPEREHTKLSSTMIMLFQLASIGLFSANNLFVFFIFWDIGVISMFVMINVLGSANRRAASINFLIYEIFASSMLLLAIILLYTYTPTHTLQIGSIASLASQIPPKIQLYIFILLFVAFMTNMPIFPMHFWLPDAHAEASTQGSMLLSGILTKFGGYGMFLLFLMMPIAREYAYIIAALAIFSSIWGALILIRQTDIKRIVAYSTIVEMAIILMAISSYSNIGEAGAVFGMLSHGLTVSLMFLAAGTIKYIFSERNTTRLRGILLSTPASTYAFIIAALSMIGFPLTTGFVTDILIFIGSFQSFGLYALIPLLSILIVGIFMYSLISKSFLYVKESSEPSAYIGKKEALGYYIIAGAIILIGVVPLIIINLLGL